MTPVQEVCRKLWRPTPPLQHLTRQLQRWPRVLRKSARSRLLLLDLDTLGLVLRRQRASLPNKNIPRAWRTPETGSPSKTFSHGWMQEVCRIALALPPLQHELLTNVFDLLFIRPSRSLQPCPRPLLVPPLCVPRLFRLLPPSLVLLSSRVKTPHVIFAAPHSADEILDFIVDPVFLSTFCVDIDFNRDSGTETVFSSAVQGGNAAQTGFRPRTIDTTYTLRKNEGTKIGEPPASLTPTRPESTGYTRQPTARSARRIARHAAIAAAQSRSISPLR